MKREQATELLYYWMENVSKQETSQSVQAKADQDTGSSQRPAPTRPDGR
jgi:hypothetical protein